MKVSVSERIIPCEEGCRECEEDSRRFNELIEILSSMHLKSSKDPGTLCAASFRDFDQDHPRFAEFSVMQGDLFEIANRHKLRWAQI